MPLLAFLMTAAFFTYLVLCFRDRKPLFTVIGVALTVRLLAAVLFFYVFKDIGFVADAVWFDQQAWSTVLNGNESIFDGFATGAALYTWIVSLIYTVDGHHPFIPILLNVLIGVCTVDLSWRIAHQCTEDSRVSKTVAWICALSPFSAFFSSIMYREPFVVVFLLIGVLNAVEWSKNSRFVPFVKSVAGFTLSGMFHSGSTLALSGFAVLLGLSLIEAAKFNQGRKLLRSIGTGLALLTVVYVIFYFGAGLEKFTTGQDIAGAQSIAARGRGAYLVGVVPSNWMDLTWMVPLRGFFFLFTPFPWQITTGTDIFAFFEAIFLAFLFGTILLHLKVIWRHPGFRTMLVLLVVLISVYSLGVSNYGTALRHREKFLPLIVVLAVGARSIRRRQQQPESLRSYLPPIDYEVYGLGDTYKLR